MTDRADLAQLTDLDRKILEAALEEFQKSGFHLANIDLVAKKLKIGKGTIYRHFGNKLYLFIWVLYFMIERVAGEFSEKIQGFSFEESLRFFIDRLVDFNRTVGKFMLLLSLEEGSSHLQKEIHKNRKVQRIYRNMTDKRNEAVLYLAEILERGKREGRIRAGLNCVVEAELILVLVNNFLRVQYTYHGFQKSIGIEKDYTLDEAVAALKGFICRGLGLEEGVCG